MSSSVLSLCLFGVPLSSEFADSSAIVANWDASDPSTITLSGSNVTAWTDKKNGYSLTPVSTSPVIDTGSVNNLNAIKFTAAGQTLSNSGVLNSGNFPSNIGSLIIVYSLIDSVGEQHLINTGSAGSGYFRWGGDGNGYADQFRSSRINAEPDNMPTTGNHIVSFRSGSGASNYEVVLDGVSKVVDSPSWGIRSTLEVGKDGTGDTSNVRIGQIIIYNNAEASMLALDTASLRTKWGI